MRILVTGAAGYIGSHTARYLKEQGCEVTVVDNLVTGHEEMVIADHFYKEDIKNIDKMIEIMRKHEIEGVIHFAAFSLVGVSMKEPYEYYDNNLYGTMCLLKAMKEVGVSKIVFSSTAATYGEPKEIPITENSETNPTNTYGETKLAMEKMMKWFDIAYGIKYVALRYFNAAGASKDSRLGELHNPETHLIPLVLQVATGKRADIKIFGDDYDTEDGSAVRDYIHVLDLASCHYLAMKYLLDKGKSDYFNLGNGKGFSVKEIVEAARQVTGKEIPAVITERRPGDPAVLVATSQKAQEVLGWRPKYTDIKEIISDAYNFFVKRMEEGK